jgi:hypothetical protein
VIGAARGKERVGELVTRMRCSVRFGGI